MKIVSGFNNIHDILLDVSNVLFMFATCHSLYRYELHEWLFALHNAMDEFKQHSLQRKKSQVRDRASSTSNTSSAATNKTPPRIKPSRPAPPIPKVGIYSTIL